MLIKVQCPNCGTNMEVDGGQTKLHCKYCGCEIVSLKEKSEITQNVNVSGTVKHVHEYEKEDPKVKAAKRSARMKKILGKGAFAVGCIVAAVLVLGLAAGGTLLAMRGCRSKGSTVAVATPTPAPTPVPGHEIYAHDMLEAPPLEKLGLSAGHLEEYSLDLMLPENWIDMTKDGITDFRVIRSKVLGCSYIVQDGEYYRLGEGEDGKGLVDYIVTDLDWDDEPDVLYTYHNGANEDSYSKVGWFNFATHQNVMSDFSQKETYLALLEENGNCILYRADRSVDPDTFSFGLTLTERLGEITEVMGRVTLILDAPPTPVSTPDPR